MLEVIHYGSDVYDSNKFKPIKNIQFRNKPRGGLWTSPINSIHSWKDWCVDNEFSLDRLNKSFTILINKGARILTINTINDLEKLPLNNISNTIAPTLMHSYDFEKISEDYDVIHLTAIGESNTRLILSHNFYGWDCETCFIMNPNCFIVL